MFDFATAIVVEVVDVTQAGLDLIDPTTFFGGAVALSLVGGIITRLARGILRMAR